MDSTTSTTITPLSDSALLRSKGLWRIVDGKSLCPFSDEEKIEAWQDKASKAAGLIALSHSDSQRVYLEDIEDDPVQI